MALEGRFDAARAALLGEIERCPRDHTEVLFCGADLRRVLAPGEDRALAERLEQLAPAAVGESMTRALRAEKDTRFVVVGDAPRAAVVEALPERPCRGPRPREALASASSPSAWPCPRAMGRPTAVPVGLEGDGAAAAQWTLDGEAGAIGGDAVPLQRTETASRRRADVPLDGRTLGVSLPGSGTRARAPPSPCARRRSAWR